MHIDTATEDSELVKQAFFFFFLLLFFFLVIPTPTCVQPQLPVLLESQVSAASLPKTPQKNNNKRKTKQRSKGTGLGARSFQRRGPTLGPRGTQISARSAAASTSPAVEHPQAGGGRWLCPGGTAQRRAPAVLRARRKNGFVVFRFLVGCCLVCFLQEMEVERVPWLCPPRGQSHLTPQSPPPAGPRGPPQGSAPAGTAPRRGAATGISPAARGWPGSSGGCSRAPAASFSPTVP